MKMLRLGMQVVPGMRSVRGGEVRFVIGAGGGGGDAGRAWVGGRVRDVERSAMVRKGQNRRGSVIITPSLLYLRYGRLCNNTD